MNLRHRKGFSLIELMVAITILSILIFLALPNFGEWLVNTHIRNAAESIQNGLRLARTEAVKRDTNIRFQFTSNSNQSDWTLCVPATPKATNCTGGEVLQSFVSAGGATNVLIGATGNVTAATAFGTALSGGVPAGITYDPLGRPVDYSLSTGAASIVRIDSASARAGTRRLVTTVSPGGQVRMCDPQLSLSVSPQGCS